MFVSEIVFKFLESEIRVVDGWENFCCLSMMEEMLYILSLIFMFF